MMNFKLWLESEGIGHRVQRSDGSWENDWTFADRSTHPEYGPIVTLTKNNLQKQIPLNIYQSWNPNITPYRFDGPIHYEDRDIVLVLMDNGGRMPFYRSTGENSGMAGHWLPFSGIGVQPGGLWFDKKQFTAGELNNRAHPLHRYGSDKLKQVAAYLDQLNIPVSRQVFTDPVEVNTWLNTPSSLKNNVVLKFLNKRT
jgi:hypothetical protein